MIVMFMECNNIFIWKYKELLKNIEFLLIDMVYFKKVFV